VGKRSAGVTFYKFDTYDGAVQTAFHVKFSDNGFGLPEI
jgi:hypothetical protein